MRALSEFKPPKPNRLVIWFCEALLPVYVNIVERLTFRFFESPGQPLKFLKGKSVVVVINHGDRQDPLVVVALAKHMGEAFYCLVAREVFDWYNGMLGWLFQKLGCYSVNRGVADFRSIHTTHQILAHSHSKLIVFPESEITGDEQSVHELNASFIHLLLESQEDLAKSASGQSIWVLPIGVSYRLESSLEKSVSRLLRKIERRLHIDQKESDDIESRVFAAVDKVLQNFAKRYMISFGDAQSRVEQVRISARLICERIANYTDFKTEHLKTEEMLMYFLRNRVANGLATVKHHSAAQAQSLSPEVARTYRNFLEDLDRVERLLILHRILKHPSSPIQICRIMDFLEAETTGRMTKKGRQCASILIGKPIEVLPYLQSYKSCKDTAIKRLSTDIRRDMQTTLDSSRQISNPSHGTTSRWMSCFRTVMRQPGV